MSRIVEAGALLGPSHETAATRLQEAEATKQLAHNFTILSGIVPRFAEGPVFTASHDTVEWKAQRQGNGSFSITRTELVKPDSDAPGNHAVESLLVNCDEYPSSATANPRISYEAGSIRDPELAPPQDIDLALPNRADDPSQVAQVTSVARDFLGRFADFALDIRKTHEFVHPWLTEDEVDAITKNFMQYFSEQTTTIPGLERFSSYLVNEWITGDFGDIDNLTPDGLPFYRVARRGNLLHLEKVSADTEGLNELFVKNGHTHSFLHVKGPGNGGNSAIHAYTPRVLSTAQDQTTRIGFGIVQEFLDLVRREEFPQAAEPTPDMILGRLGKFTPRTFLRKGEYHAAKEAILAMLQNAVAERDAQAADKLAGVQDNGSETVELTNGEDGNEKWSITRSVVDGQPQTVVTVIKPSERAPMYWDTKGDGNRVEIRIDAPDQYDYSFSDRNQKRLSVTHYVNHALKDPRVGSNTAGIVLDIVDRFTSLKTNTPIKETIY
ncbi:MAG: hypothetical protein HY431_03005 [Candidatus Levybacteria bacterium]|nr:hypothetical protein [Candidatus Levybacteria bacterium]